MDIEIPQAMGDAAMLALVVGFLSPIVLNFIIKATWPSWVKSLTAFGFSAVVGVITALVAGAYDGLSIVSTVLLTLVVAITSYQNFWKQVAPNMQRGTEVKAQEVEAAERDRILTVAEQAYRPPLTTTDEAQRPNAPGVQGV